ncbi:hypothetical protein CC78DRAFT_541630 [Lojkania enalia]|uniref:Uncharacterized protein n=1 Tax=Lojkania enalia TaxID=147567 RepID=A0A9P4KG56_9PLEO|nr:hypothetical protein CC78DRAFT_541630 [Didymosphaeria enalia]
MRCKRMRGAGRYGGGTHAPSGPLLRCPGGWAGEGWGYASPDRCLQIFVRVGVHTTLQPIAVGYASQGPPDRPQSPRMYESPALLQMLMHPGRALVHDYPTPLLANSELRTASQEHAWQDGTKTIEFHCPVSHAVSSEHALLVEHATAGSSALLTRATMGQQGITVSQSLWWIRGLERPQRRPAPSLVIGQSSELASQDKCGCKGSQGAWT